jgi:hypothetical protein
MITAWFCCKAAPGEQGVCQTYDLLIQLGIWDGSHSWLPIFLAHQRALPEFQASSGNCTKQSPGDGTGHPAYRAS